MCASKNIEADTKQNSLLSKPNPGLYIVSTPIGNLKDISFRALEILKSSDSVVCEDTRVTQKLLSHYGIKNKLTAYNDHNASKVRGSILKWLQSGDVVALVSDAGTPLISDPGYKLVKAVREKDINVYTVPGASAVVAALTVCAFPTDRFYFGGFLPDKIDAQEGALKNIANVDSTIVFYQSPKKLHNSLESIARTIGDNRQVAVVRELTKKFEEVISGSIDEVIAETKKREIKGEIVLLLSPPANLEIDHEALDEKIERFLNIKGVKDIAAILHEDFGGSKKNIYDRIQEIKDGQKSKD